MPQTPPPLPDLSAFAEAITRALTACGPDAGRVTTNAPIATTMRVGGVAALLLDAYTPAAVAAALPCLNAVPCAVVGLGSNLILPDEGFPGVVLRLSGALKQPTPDLTQDPNNDHAASVTFGAGVPNAHAVRALHSLGWVGLEHVALVPGTLGGAVAMNAGTKHGEISAALLAAEVATPDGTLRWLDAADLRLSYRTAHLPPGAVITRARAHVRRADPQGLAAAQAQVQAEKQYRAATQPFKLATSGSIFRNPPGDYAGRLIEACGLKGHRVGEAVISPMHANWIVNEGGARAADVVALIDAARVAVWQRFGVALHPEVRLLSPSATWDERLTPLR